MARLDEAKAAANALAKNMEIIGSACLDSRGEIQDSSDNSHVISALLKNRLAFRMDNNFSVQLTGVVTRFVQHTTKGHRRRISSGVVADLLDSLRFSVENYRMARKSCSFKDSELYEAEIQESTYEIIDNLRSITQQFAYYVQNEFSNVSDLNLRIKENERCVSEAVKINDLFDTLTVSELAEMASTDPFLERMLISVLKVSIDTCRMDLTDSLHRLRETLSKLLKDKEYQHKNDLVDAFYSHYQRNPGFVPDIDSLGLVPDMFNQAVPIELGALPNIDDAEQTETLASLVQGLREPAIVKSDTDAEVVVISDETSSEIEGVLDPFEENLQYFFDALPVLAYDAPYSALTGYAALKVDESEELWLIGLVNFYDGLPQHQRKLIRLEYVEHACAVYTGNRYVRDLMFEVCS